MGVTYRARLVGEAHHPRRPQARIGRVPVVYYKVQRKREEGVSLSTQRECVCWNGVMD